jgi:osmotically-inducible protein OsmY
MRRSGIVVVLGLVCVAACAPSDTRITETVRSRMAADAAVHVYDLNVMTRNKIVTLTGTVDNSAARDRAARVARDADGVIDVINRVRVSETAATSGTKPTPR